MISRNINKALAVVEKKTHFSVLWSNPYYIQLEITRNCNLNCLMCLRHQQLELKAGGNMSLDLFRNIINDFPFIGAVNITGFGEPTLNPEFEEMLCYLKEKKIEPIIFTNLLVATKEQMIAMLSCNAELQISICGTKQNYERIQENANWERLLEQLQLLYSIKKELGSLTEPLLNYTVSSNQEDIVETFKTFYALGFRRFKFNQPYFAWLGKDDLEQLDLDKVGKEFLRLQDFVKQNNIELKELSFSELKTENELVCDSLWNSVFVNWQGKVFPCINIIDEQNPFGDLQKESFEQIWNNQAFQWHRKERISPCIGCQKILLKAKA